MSKYYEDLTPGDVFEHAVRRTMTETDNVLFTVLSHNDQPLHLDEEFARSTPYGTRVVNSIYTMAFVCGVTVSDLTLGTTLGNLGFEEVRFPKPVLTGDTLRSRTRVISKRDSASNPKAGIVLFEHVGFNQRDEIVVTARRAAMMLKRPVSTD